MKAESSVRPSGVLLLLALLFALLAVGAVAAAPPSGEADADLHTLVALPFERAYGFDPFDEARLEQVLRHEGRVRALPGFAETVAAGRQAAADPEDPALEEKLASRLGSLLGTVGSGDVLATLFFVVRESIAAQNEDKKYWLHKLSDLNAMGEAMSDALEEIREASVQLASARRKEDQSLAMLTRVLAARPDLRQAVAAPMAERAAAAAAPARVAAPSPQLVAKIVPGTLALLIQGEALVPSAVSSAGPVDVQPMQGFGGQWSGDAQLFWRPPAPVDQPIRNWPNLRLRLEVKAAGTYALTLLHTVAPDYGKFRVFLDGSIVADVDGWGPRVDVREHSLGKQDLAAGSHQMILTVFARNPSSQGWFVGVDALRLTPVSEVSSGAAQPRPRLERAPAAEAGGARVAPAAPQVDLVTRIAAPAPLPATLTREDRAALAGVAQALERGDAERARRAWERLLGTVASRPGATVDVDALIHWVLRESYLDQMGDLADHAAKLRFYNEQKKAIREHLQELRAVRADLAPGATTSVRTITVAPEYSEGGEPTREGPLQLMSAEELSATIESFEEELQTVGDDAQLAQLDLQNVLQKQQQTLQTLSNVSKTLHDTATAVIRNLD